MNKSHQRGCHFKSKLDKQRYVEITKVSHRPRIKADTRKGVAVEYLT